ncbi:MAG: hypothetical protein LBG92_05655 [Prevotellaceae bacterium]|nr:hypothetical protein [Prevotellaceae bacterium]
MIHKFFNLRNVAAMAVCLAGMTVFSGCNSKDNNDENPYNNLTQAEIIDLLTDAYGKSFNAPEVACNVKYNGKLSSTVERNVSQKRHFDAEFSNANETLSNFIYVENLTRYEYQRDSNLKIISTVDTGYWNHKYEEGVNGEFEHYTWTVSGKTFTGTGENGTVFVCVLNDNRQFVSVNIVDDYETRDITFSYANVNPAFPAGFDKADFKEEQGENLLGKVKSINGTEVHYTDGNGKGFVSGIGDFDINRHVWKSGFGLGFLDYIKTHGDSSNYDHFYYDHHYNGQQQVLDSIRYYPLSSWSNYLISRYTWNAGNLSRISGDQIGVSRDGELVTTFEYDAEYSKGNLDISFLIASTEYFVGPSNYFVAFDNNNCIRSKNLIAKKIQKGPANESGKYNLTITYRYEFNANGYVTKVFAGEDLILELEYY